MKENQKRVLKSIRDCGGVTNSHELRRRTGYDNDMVRSVTKILKRDGYIESESQVVEVPGQSTKANRYTLTDDGKEEASELGELVAQSEIAAEVEALRSRVSYLEDKNEELREALDKADEIMFSMQERISELEKK